MADVLVRFDSPVTDEKGRTFVVRICGRLAEDGMWEGWIEFDPQDGGPALRTPRETEQPNEADLKYWATGLTLSYLEGALERAREFDTPDLRPPPVAAHPTFDRPAVSRPEPTTTAVPHGLAAQLPAIDPVIDRGAALNPYRVFSREGEVALRSQLSALDESELHNVIRAYKVIDDDEIDLLAMHQASLVELAVAAIRKLYGS